MRIALARKVYQLLLEAAALHAHFTVSAAALHGQFQQS